MKRFLIGAALAVTTLFTFTPESNAVVSISVGEPGYYGQLNIGGYPPPRVYYRQPKIINYRYGAINRPPIYLRVRPGHARQWSRYCQLYNACHERVYFVQHDWYHREYAPRYIKYHRRYPSLYHRGNDYNHRDDNHDHRGDDHDHRGDGQNHRDDDHDHRSDIQKHLNVNHNRH